MRRLEDLHTAAAGNAEFQEAVDEIQMWRARANRYDIATAAMMYQASVDSLTLPEARAALKRMLLTAIEEDD